MQAGAQPDSRSSSPARSTTWPATATPFAQVLSRADTCIQRAASCGKANKLRARSRPEQQQLKSMASSHDGERARGEMKTARCRRLLEAGVADIGGARGAPAIPGTRPGGIGRDGAGRGHHLSRRRPAARGAAADTRRAPGLLESRAAWCRGQKPPPSAEVEGRSSWPGSARWCRLRAGVDELRRDRSTAHLVEASCMAASCRASARR